MKVAQIFEFRQSLGSNWIPFYLKAEILKTVPTMPAHVPQYRYHVFQCQALFFKVKIPIVKPPNPALVEDKHMKFYYM